MGKTTKISNRENHFKEIFPIRQVSSRLEELRRFASKESLGLEVGPFFRPICPKNEGYNIVTLDVFSRDQLIKNYAEDPNVSPYFDNIEEVDIVSSRPLLEAISTSEAVKNITNGSSCFDFILTSHNFEHLPNPIQFLQDAEILLQTEGHLTMAIPIHTRCFDLYKSLSSTGSLIDAYTNQVTKPSLGTVFDHHSLSAQKKDGSPIGSPQFDSNDVTLIWSELEQFQTNPDINKREWFNQLQADLNSKYIDAHCHCFNPASFCLIIADLRLLGLVKELHVHDICEHGLEFIVHLQKGKPKQAHTFKDYSRTALVQAASLYSAAELLPRPETTAINVQHLGIYCAKKLAKSWEETRSFLHRLRQSLRR